MDQADWRKRVGYVALFLGLAWAGLVFALEETEVVGTPMLRLPTMFFFLVGWSYYLSGRQKV